MSTPELLVVDEAYGLSATARFTWNEVIDEKLESFAATLTTLRRQLAGELDDPFWQHLIANARGVFWALAGTPLPASHPAIALEQGAERLRSMSILASEISMLGPVVESLAQILETVLSDDLDPLGDAVRSIFERSDEGRTCVLLRWPRRQEAVHEWFDAHSLAGRRLTVASAHALRDLVFFDSIVAVGPSMWFDGLISAPRAASNHIVHLRVTRDRPRRPAMFANSRSRGQRLQRKIQPSSDDAWADQLRRAIDEELLRPRTEWGAIDARGRRDDGAIGEDVEDLVQARLILLARDQAVYIEAEEGSGNWILDPRASGEERIRLEGWRELTPGMFLVLRTEGGSNIAIIADGILGSRASLLRRDQQKWKDDLKAKARARGMAITLRELRAFGCGVASEQNVRNWTSIHTIAPGKRSDFDAVMRFVGLGATADRLWQQVLTIRQAHRAAGNQLRAALVAEMERADLSTLATTGRLDVELPELGAGTLSVLRIEDISPEPYSISRYRVDEPFSVEETAWRG
jgi:hypothetical protein